MLYTTTEALGDLRQREIMRGKRLSPRELDVLRRMVAGWTVKRAAHDLEIGRRTIEVMIRKARYKLGSDNVHDVVRVAVASGLVEVGDVDPYEVLGLDRSATKEDVDAAYRRAARRTHPDAGGNRNEFEEVTLAADVLRDPDRRAKYDQTGDLCGEPHVMLSAAMGLIIQVIDNLVGQWVGNPFGGTPDPSEGKLLEAVNEQLRRQADDLRRPMEQLTRGVASLERMEKRLRRLKKGDETLAAAIRHHRDHVAGQKKQLDQKLAAIKMAQEIISQHSYDSPGKSASSLVDALYISRRRY